MNLAELRAELEEDLAWRIDELRHLRNSLISSTDVDSWPVSSMRAILVMQYAHLEGFVRNSMIVYVQFINDVSLRADELHLQLVASALTGEFDDLRKSADVEVQQEGGENARLFKRARKQVAFVEKLRRVTTGPIFIDANVAVSMEMNLGSDVLRRTLYMLGIPDSTVDAAQYSALEFVRRARNDIAHGSRKERIAPGLFNAHRIKCEEFMSGLVRTVTEAARSEWYRIAVAPSSP